MTRTLLRIGFGGRALLRIGAALTGLLPATAFAQYGIISGTIDAVGGMLTDLGSLPSGEFACQGPGCGAVLIVASIITRFRPLLTVVGGLIITIFGVKMITAQEDDLVQKARPMMTGLASGLILLWLLVPFLEVFYGSRGQVFTGAMGSGIQIANTEISGIIRWALTLAAVSAIFSLAIVGMKAVFNPTSEDNIANIRKTLIYIAGGMLLLALHALIAQRFIGNTLSPVPLLTLVLSVVSFLMGFLALAAVVVLVYSGFRLVLSMGNEEAWTQAKGHLIRASIGFLLIIVSLALVNFIIMPAVS